MQLKYWESVFVLPQMREAHQDGETKNWLSQVLYAHSISAQVELNVDSKQKAVYIYLREKKTIIYNPIEINKLWAIGKIRQDNFAITYYVIVVTWC